MDTLLLDQTLWDLCLDAAGNIALASAPYSLAQDAASAIRLFAGELWYDSSKGIPYFDQVLGQFPPAPFLIAQFEAAALSVPGIVAAQCTLNALSARVLSGSVLCTTDAGTATVTFAGDSSGLSTSIGAA